MQFEFVVHSAIDSTVNKEVQLDGHPVVAAVPAFTVELVSTTPGGGTYSHNFVGAEIEEAKKAFVWGQKVRLSPVA